MGPARSAAAPFIALVVAATFTAACVPASDREGPTPPPDISLIGTIRLDGIAARSDPPGLVAPGDGPTVFPVSAADPWLAIGYTDAQLAAYTPPSPGILAADPLEVGPPTACGALPAPAWRVPLTGAAEGAAAQPFSVRTSWSRRCSPGPHARWLDVRCVDAMGCGGELVESGCTLAPPATSPDCAALEPRFEVEHDGGACLAEAAEGAACAVEPGAHAGTRWRCQGCVIDTYPPTPPPDWGVTSWKLGRDFRPPDDLALKTGRPRHFEMGTLSALGVRDDVVLVTPRGGDENDGGLCYTRSSSIPGALLRLDAETGAVLERHVVPGRCFTRLVPDPHGPGMIATYYQGTTLTVARLDRTGREVQTSTLARPVASERIDHTLALVVTSSTWIAVMDVVELLGDQPSPEHSWLYVLDARTLAPAPPRAHLEVEVTGMTWASDAHRAVFVAHIEAGLDGVREVPLAGPAPAQLLSLGPHTRPRAPVLLESGLVAVIEMWVVHGLLQLTSARLDGHIVGVARPIEAPAMAAELLEVRGTGHAVGSVMAELPERRWQAALATVELGAQDLRYLPGMLRLTAGEAPIEGPVTQMAFDGRGRLWGLASWSGRVIRASRAPVP